MLKKCWKTEHPNLVYIIKGNHPDKISNLKKEIIDSYNNTDTEGLNLPITVAKSKLLFRNVAEWPKLIWMLISIFCIIWFKNIFINIFIFLIMIDLSNPTRYLPMECKVGPWDPYSHASTTTPVTIMWKLT